MNSPQSQDELDKLILKHYPDAWTKVWFEDFKKELLAWRRTTSLEALPEKQAHTGDNYCELVCECGANDYNQAIDLTKKNIKEQ